ncbi:MAG TPA: menaquinone biosynthesis protein, partial [Thermoanaerobaculia bacterium]
MRGLSTVMTLWYRPSAMHYALISFLNARPLWWGLTHDPRPGDTFEFTSPARCADLLAEGKAHLGLIPAIELARIPDLIAIPEICIASKSEVRSVLLLSRVPFDRIRSVALDPSSRTSLTLARILLAERLGSARYESVKFDAVEGDALVTLEGHDAAVVIGDRALRATLGETARSYEYVYDLVREWHTMFDEPFVFALWAGRRDVVGEDPRLCERLRASQDLVNDSRVLLVHHS